MCPIYRPPFYIKCILGSSSSKKNVPDILKDQFDTHLECTAAAAAAAHIVWNLFYQDSRRCPLDGWTASHLLLALPFDILFSLFKNKFQMESACSILDNVCMKRWALLGEMIGVDMHRERERERPPGSNLSDRSHNHIFPSVVFIHFLLR